MPFRPLAPFSTFVRIVRRDGFAVFPKMARYCFSPGAWRWLLRGGRGPGAVPSFSEADLAAIRASKWFDPAWYLREHIDVKRAGLDPAVHFAAFGCRGYHDPGPDFSAEEYFQLNEDVRINRSNPLAHFERFGRAEGRPISFLQGKAKPFPEGAVETEREFPAAPIRRRRVAVFAVFFPAGRIPETTMCYLRALNEVADDVLLYANCPVFPDEIRKLDGLVRFAAFRVHGGHDFFSYRLGFEKARELGLLDAARTDELVLANDSCYAPVFPLPDCFAKMADRPCDFWGMTANSGAYRSEHVQSFFFVFRRRVLDGDALARFLGGIEILGARWEVVRRYEIGFTAALVEAGYSWDTLVPRTFSAEHGGGTPTKHVLETFSFGMPLVKVKGLDRYMVDDRGAVLDFIKVHNPELAAAIPPAPPPIDYDAVRRIREEHPASFPGKIAAIRENRIGKGLPVRAVFFVFSASMFPAKPLFEAMRRDPAFDARIVVVPDLRWPDRDPVADMEACASELRRTLPADAVSVATRNRAGVWADVSRDADLVCYPSPYNQSDLRYNPRWAVGRPFLPVYLSYSFSTSLYGYWVYGVQNYACFWKVFVECEANGKEYAEHSILKGANAELTGCFKMDGLAAAEPWPRNGNRKRVLVAPHHSVDGGSNDTLAFSNFERYADFFLALPERHPELDFVFRPHPFLFTVLSRPSKWGPERVADWIARMKAHPNVRWSDEGDYFPAFASCDAIVQDCGSYLVEWFYTGKPCCYMLKDPSDLDAKFTPLGKECLSHCYLAYDESSIESFLRDVVEGGSDPKAAARDEFRKAIMVNYPHAAEAALSSIRRALGLGRRPAR